MEEYPDYEYGKEGDAFESWRGVEARVDDFELISLKHRVRRYFNGYI